MPAPKPDFPPGSHDGKVSVTIRLNPYNLGRLDRLRDRFAWSRSVTVEQLIEAAMEKLDVDSEWRIR